MPRGIRFLEKKRGDRTTGSSNAGWLGEALFYSIFLIIGLVGVAYLLLNVQNDIQANKDSVESTCKIIDKQLGERTNLNLTRYRPELHVKYKADGEEFESVITYDAANEFRFEETDAQAVLERYEIGKEYPCWYNKYNPKLVVLVLYQPWPWVLLVIFGSFAVFGGAGVAYSLMHSRLSRERRLSRAAVAKADNSKGPDGKAKSKYPNIPKFENISDSPGTDLAFRLPRSYNTGWQLLGLGISTVLWNSIIGYLAYQVVSGFLQRDPNWLLTAFVLPFMGAGAWLIYAWVRQILIAAGIGGTRIEIESHPLEPGGKYAVVIAQSGRMKLNRITAAFVCEERATYHQGTDTRSETQRVYEEVVFSEENITIDPAADFKAEFTLTVPESAMHSFVGEHNEVTWMIIVHGDVDKWPDYERRYSVCIYPKKSSQK